MSLRRLSVNFALCLLITYFAVLAVAWWQQRALLYFPASSRVQDDNPGRNGLQGFQRILLRTADDRRLVAWWRPPAIGRGVVVYLHGNGGSLPDGADRMREFADAGLGVLGVEYRGYGRSDGSPSEEGLIHDGLAGYDAARAAAPHVPIALYGESLGTGVAVAVAQRRPVVGLVLDSAFSSTLRLAQHRYAWLLPALLMKDRWDSERRMRAIRTPVLAAHCTADRVVPLAEAQRLAAAGEGHMRLIVLPGCGHIQTWDAGLREPALKALVAWTSPGTD